MSDIIIPSQTVKVADFDPTPILTLLKDIDKRLTKLESALPPAVPVPFQMYASTSFWNKKLTTEAIDSNSTGFVSELFANTKLAGVSVNTTQYGRPIYFVDSSVPKVPVTLLQDIGGAIYNELLLGVPIPQGAIASGGNDGHMCIIDTSANKEYDFWQIKLVNGKWQASTAGIMPNVSTSDGTMPRLSVWCSATASHLPLAGGVLMDKELKAGVIPHALAIAINRPKLGIAKAPAKTTDGWYTGANAIEEGRRFRFSANIVINPAWTPITKMIVTAIRDYSCIVMDKTGAGVSFVSEPTVTISDYFAGKPSYKIFGDANNVAEFPWASLVALA